MSEITCYCFNIEKRRIVEAIEDGCKSVHDIQMLLGATGNCASCQPDIEAMLDFYNRFPTPIVRA